MRRRTHQLAYMRPVVPDVCPWPMRFQCCPTLDLAASLAAPAVFSAEAADRACQPLSQDRVDRLGWWGCRTQQLFPWVRYCRHRLCPHPDETNAPAHARTDSMGAGCEAGPPSLLSPVRLASGSIRAREGGPVMSVYAGIDVHRKRSQVAVTGAKGKVIANRNVPNGVGPILKVIGGWAPRRRSRPRSAPAGWWSCWRTTGSPRTWCTRRGARRSPRPG
jgi:hypothetical protein